MPFRKEVFFEEDIKYFVVKDMNVVIVSNVQTYELMDTASIKQ